MYNLPNILTISRIVVIPVIFLSVYIPGVLWSFLAAILFAVASITDYFDGYLARSRNQISVFGRLLDPIADKLLVVSTLLIIVANNMVHPITYIPVMVILCREVLVSGLREFLADVKISMPVTRLAKWKTGFQMVSLGMILFSAMPSLKMFNTLGEVLLWVAGVLTFITGYQYFQKSLDYVKSIEDSNGKNKDKKVPEAKIVETVKVEETGIKNEKAKSVKKVAGAKKAKTVAKVEKEKVVAKKTTTKVKKTTSVKTKKPVKK